MTTGRRFVFQGHNEIRPGGLQCGRETKRHGGGERQTQGIDEDSLVGRDIQERQRSRYLAAGLTLV
jgi:hypothetical protein